MSPLSVPTRFNPFHRSVKTKHGQQEWEDERMARLPMPELPEPVLEAIRLAEIRRQQREAERLAEKKRILRERGRAYRARKKAEALASPPPATF